MKRWTVYLSVIFISALLYSGIAWPAQVCSPETPQQHGNMFVQKVSWTAAADGSFTGCDLLYPVNGILAWIETSPGSPTPTASYYPIFTTSSGLAISTSARSASTQEVTKPTASGTTQMVGVSGKMTMSLSGNSANGAKGTVWLYWFGE